MDKVVSFFQVCHAMDQPLHEQRQHETAAKKNARKLTKRGMLPTRNVLLLIEATLQALAMINLKNVVAQKISVATAKLMVIMWHEIHALVTIFDTPTIVTNMATHSILVTLNHRECNHKPAACDHNLPCQTLQPNQIKNMIAIKVPFSWFLKPKTRSWSLYSWWW